MDGARFDTLTRSLDSRSRRRLLGAIAGVAVSLGPPALWSTAAAKKKGKKRKKPCPDCPLCPAVPAPLTCPQTCPSSCAFCYIRPGAPTMCGDIGGIADCFGTACSSDAGCGAGLPFCVSQLVDRSTGEVFDTCPTPGAFCASIPAC